MATAMAAKNSLHSGHKVVAMPTSNTFGGTNTQDSSASQYEERSTTPYQRRGRSRSADRGPVSRSRDIVQDVYDRMGVNYIRGRPSIENLLEDNKALGGAGAKKPGQGRPVSRGRPTTRRNEYSGDSSGRRQRSVSKGRVANAWPPVSSRQSEVSRATVPAARSKVVTDPTILPNTRPKERVGSSTPNRWQSSSVSSFPSSNEDGRDEESKPKDIYAPDDERDAMSVISVKSTKSTKSVKDRISTYRASIGTSTAIPRPNVSSSASTSSRMHVRNSFVGGVNNKQRSHPPKVNLYDSVSVSNDGAGDPVEPFVDSDAVDQTGCVSATKNSDSNKSNLADAFLSTMVKSGSSHSPRATSRNIPMIEIPREGLQVSSDMHSIAASSVSGEDFTTASPKKSSSRRFTSFSVARADGTASTVMMEKLIEERVHAQLFILNKKFEAEIRRVENRIDQECKARIKSLETQNQVLLARLSQQRGV